MTNNSKTLEKVQALNRERLLRCPRICRDTIEIGALSIADTDRVLTQFKPYLSRSRAGELSVAESLFNAVTKLQVGVKTNE